MLVTLTPNSFTNRNPGASVLEPVLEGSWPEALPSHAMNLMVRTTDEDRNLTIASILLAEDSEDDRALAFRALRRCGLPVAVQVATDGQRALALLEDRQVGVPALVVLDVKMPRLSGIEVLSAIRDDVRFDRVPVVMMTSSDEPTDIEVCRRLGADAYMRKPVDFEQYLALVAEIAQFWLSHPRGTEEVPNSLLNSMVVSNG